MAVFSRRSLKPALERRPRDAVVFNGMRTLTRLAAVVAWTLAGFGMAFGAVVTWPAAPGTACTNDYVLSVAGRNVDVMAVPKST